MNIAVRLSILLIVFALFSCKNEHDKKQELTPKEKLSQAYQLFKEGKDKESVTLAEEVLAIGKKTKNDTLVGKALTSLCRNAQRSLDTNRLAALSLQLEKLSAKTGDQKWLMYRAHQNAEMWRLIGNMDRAEKYYDESMKISEAIGAEGMFMIDHFNKSFVSTAKGNFKEANDLIKKYYALRTKAQNAKTIAHEPQDPYGLIAIAYLLEQQKKYTEAHEVAVTTRRLFEEQNIFPEPPDEKPLLAVEQKVKEELSEASLNEASSKAATLSVSKILEKYIE